MWCVVSDIVVFRFLICVCLLFVGLLDLMVLGLMVLNLLRVVFGFVICCAFGGWIYAAFGFGFG